VLLKRRRTSEETCKKTRALLEQSSLKTHSNDLVDVLLLLRPVLHLVEDRRAKSLP